MKNPGFWAIPKEILRMTKLSLESRMVYGLLWTRANSDNIAWPGQRYIAEELGISERSVRRYVKELEASGLIQVDQQGLRRTNRYFLTGQLGRSRPDRAGRSRPDNLAGPIVRDSIVRDEMKGATAPAVAAGADLSRAVADLFDVFKKSVNPLINFGHKTMRRDAEELIRKFGVDAALELAQAACQVQGERFAPVITNPYQLKLRLPELGVFMKRREGEKKGAVI